MSVRPPRVVVASALVSLAVLAACGTGEGALPTESPSSTADVPASSAPTVVESTSPASPSPTRASPTDTTSASPTTAVGGTATPTEPTPHPWGTTAPDDPPPEEPYEPPPSEPTPTESTPQEEGPTEEETSDSLDGERLFVTEEDDGATFEISTEAHVEVHLPGDAGWSLVAEGPEVTVEQTSELDENDDAVWRVRIQSAGTVVLRASSSGEADLTFTLAISQA